MIKTFTHLVLIIITLRRTSVIPIPLLRRHRCLLLYCITSFLSLGLLSWPSPSHNTSISSYALQVHWCTPSGRCHCSQRLRRQESALHLLRNDKEDTGGLRSLGQVDEAGEFVQIMSDFAAAGGEEEGIVPAPKNHGHGPLAMCYRRYQQDFKLAIPFLTSTEPGSTHALRNHLSRLSRTGSLSLSRIYAR